MKKKIIIGVIIAIGIATLLYFVLREGKSAIGEKIVMKMVKKGGFDVDNPVNFGRQVQAQYDKFTTKQCRDMFYLILTNKKVTQATKALPQELRKEAINKTAERLKKYRESMTEEEKEKLRKKISKKMVSRGKYNYFEDFTAEERSDIGPVVDEVLKILSKL